MSLDDRARAATDELRASVTAGLDADGMLGRMLLARRRRAAAGTVALAAAVLLATAGAITGLLLGAGDDDARTVPGHPTVTATGACASPRVTCLDGRRRVRVDLRIPLTVTLPDNFEDGVTTWGPRSVELYRSDIEHAGVTVYEDAVPVRYDASRTRAPAAGTTAASVARWLAARPYLTGTTLTRRTVAGRTGWQVTGIARAGAALPDRVGHNDAAVTFAVPGEGVSWVSPVVAGSYTLADQPGGGVTVIWSWRYGVDLPDLGEDRQVVDDLLTP
jgi:hypothetical protein